MKYISNKFLSVSIAIILLFSLIIYTRNSNEVVHDLNLFIINYDKNDISNNQIESLINELSSFKTIVKNIYYEDNKLYKREFFMKTLNEYDFNQWKRVYDAHSFSSFILQISHIIERLYISRYDDNDIDLIDLKSMMKKLHRFIELQKDFFLGDPLDGDDIINSLIINNFGFSTDDYNAIFIQINDNKIGETSSYMNNVKEIFRRYEVSYNISDKYIFNKSNILKYKKFTDLDSYEKFAKNLSSNPMIKEVFSILDYYNENENFIQYQFMNRLQMVQAGDDDIYKYFESIGVLEEKLLEIKDRYLDSQLLSLEIDRILGTEEVDGLFQELDDIIKNTKNSELKYSKLNKLFYKSMIDFVSESRSMIEFDFDLLPSEVKSFYIDDDNYVIRYY